MEDILLGSCSFILFVKGGEKCANNEDMNGTVFGEFRCPLYGFPADARYCCGEPGKQYCCQRDGYR